jgi:hypothetical protein
MAASRPLGLLQWAIIVLTAATALIHIWLAFQFESGVDPIFILNGAGYLGLLGLLYLPIAPLARYRTAIRWLLIAYTAVTVLAWLFVGARSTIAYVDKAIEIVLIACLWLEWQQGRKAIGGPEPR